MRVREIEVRYGKVVGELDGRRVATPGDVAGMAHIWIGDCCEERFGVLLLNGRHRTIGECVEVSRGTLTASLVHPREVFRAAIIRNAAAVVMIHNHPSGDSKPSSEDREVTKRMVEAGQLIGIKVVDHVIIGDGCENYFSFQEAGLLS
jgi:DNA repair protein RadC